MGTYTYRALPNPIIDLMGPLCGGKGRGEQDEEGVENRREGKRNREMEGKKRKERDERDGFYFASFARILAGAHVYMLYV